MYGPLILQQWNRAFSGQVHTSFFDLGMNGLLLKKLWFIYDKYGPDPHRFYQFFKYIYDFSICLFFPFSFSICIEKSWGGAHKQISWLEMPQKKQSLHILVVLVVLTSWKSRSHCRKCLCWDVGPGIEQAQRPAARRYFLAKREKLWTMCSSISGVRFKGVCHF